MFGNNDGWYFRVLFWRSSSKRRSQRYLMCSRSALFRPIYLKTTRITPSPPFRLRLRLMTVTILCKIMVLLLLYHSCSIQTRLNEKIPFAIISLFFFLGFLRLPEFIFCCSFTSGLQILNPPWNQRLVLVSDVCLNC